LIIRLVMLINTWYHLWL